MTRRSVIVLVAVVALLAAGVFTVMAQDGSSTTPPLGHGIMQGRHGGMMGGSFRSGMMHGDGMPMIDTVAGVLGMEPDALFDALHNGQTLTEIADAQDVALQTVYDAVIAQAEEHMAAQVEAGSITQAQADEHLTWVRDHAAEMPMFSGSGYGPCMDGEGGFAGGMMGHGHGMRGNGMRGGMS